MIFGQRSGITDVALYTWAPARTWVMRTLACRMAPWNEGTIGFPSSTAGNAQLVAKVAVGILIGLGAATLLTAQLVFAIGCLALLWSLAMVQLPLQQSAKPQLREQTLAQLDGGRPNQDFRHHQAQRKASVMATLPDDEAMTSLVEDALRHLYDRSYLGQHQLAQLQIVNHREWSRPEVHCWNTHLSLGNAVHRLLEDLIEQLHPSGRLPTGALVPPREWYPYIILHASYVQGQRTREIMARLCIGEGTYNRTRRRALQSVARAILEIEHQILSQTGNHCDKLPIAPACSSSQMDHSY